VKLLDLEGGDIYFYPERGMLDCNTYLIEGDMAVLVDPGSMQTADALIQDMKRDEIDLKGIDHIVNTHLHLDHCLADGYLRELSGAELLFHPLQKRFYHVVVEEVSEFFGISPPRIVEDGTLDKLKGVEILETPGHSPDSISFLVGGCILCGDVIFKESVGRVDLPGGDGDLLKRSIDNMSKMDIERLLPGHMGLVQGREEVKRNFSDIKAILSWL
jgi:glyoxylase-like metal-dependent hydrolase (beta-lactamase superfamily II)